MRRLLAATLVALALAGGALAGATRNILGTDRADLLVGTPAADAVSARGGDDLVSVDGDGERTRDSVSCGTGRDVVTADRADRISDDCEVVSRRLSRDTFADPTAQHQTQLEPDSFGYGNTIVAVFQSGRFTTGGADGIGWATSSDSGRTWRSGFLPGLTGAGAPFDRVSDPSIAYDALHGVWLAASLGVSPGRFGLAVSRSADGVHWQAPVVVANAPILLDKEWIACDDWPSSPFRGSCYLSYLDGSSGEIATRTSPDGGLTWGAGITVPGPVPSNSDELGAQPVIRPDGTVVVPFVFESVPAALDEVLVTRSTDGGATFAAPTLLAEQREKGVADVRAPSLPSAEVALDGTIYVAWGDCRGAPRCESDGIVLSSSTDGVTWTAPRPIPVGPFAAGTDYFVPGLGVDASSAGDTTRVALVYYSIAAGPCGTSACAQMHAWLVSSRDAGATWSKPQRLDTRTMSPLWLAASDEGAFLGDYISTSWVGGRPVPVFALANPPVAGKFREAIFATTRLG